MADGAEPTGVDNVKAQRPYRLGGFTLIELLVALAIVAIVLAAAVPGFVRLGAFAHNDAERAARDLANLLSAARMYAGTFHTDTAVVYVQRQYPGGSVVGAVSCAMARRVTDDEVRRFSVATDKRISFVLTGGGDGNFRQMPGDACLLQETLDWANKNETGVLPVALYRTNEDDALELVEPVLEYAGDARFPAHVFTASGMLRTDSPRARVSIKVGLSPEAPERERYQLGADGEIDANKPVYEQIDLYVALGRVQIAER